jgi:hypothetical protein
VRDNICVDVYEVTVSDCNVIVRRQGEAPPWRATPSATPFPMGVITPIGKEGQIEGRTRDTIKDVIEASGE